MSLAIKNRVKQSKSLQYVRCSHTHSTKPTWHKMKYLHTYLRNHYHSLYIACQLVDEPGIVTLICCDNNHSRTYAKTSHVHSGRMISSQGQVLLKDHDAVVSYFISSGHALPFPEPFFLSPSLFLQFFQVFCTCKYTRTPVFAQNLCFCQSGSGGRKEITHCSVLYSGEQT